MGSAAFVFPGQGAQHIGMGRDVYENVEEARDRFDSASRILGFDLPRRCFHGPEEDLASTPVCQPAILVTSLALLAAAREAAGGIPECSFAAGLSLGEYTALCFSGAVEFDDAVRLVHKRGQFMQDAADASAGGMTSIIGLDREAVERLCQEAAEAGLVKPANFNCPGQIVISGEIPALERAEAIAARIGAKRTVRLAVSGAFHSPFMKPARDRLEKELLAANLRIANPPVVSNVTARPVSQPGEIRQALLEQLDGPIHWEASVRFMIDSGVDTFYEIGPGKTLAGLIRRIDKQVGVINVNDLDSARKAFEPAAGEGQA